MEPRFARRSATTMKSYGSLSPPSKSFSYSAMALLTSPFWTSCCAFRLIAMFRSTLSPRSLPPRSPKSSRAHPSSDLGDARVHKLLRASERALDARFEVRAFGPGQAPHVDPDVQRRSLRAGAREPRRHPGVADRARVPHGRDLERQLERADARLRRAKRNQRRVPRRFHERLLPQRDLLRRALRDPRRRPERFVRAGVFLHQVEELTAQRFRRAFHLEHPGLVLGVLL